MNRCGNYKDNSFTNISKIKFLFVHVLLIVIVICMILLVFYSFKTNIIKTIKKLSVN